MGHRSMTKITPPKKETIPRIRSFLEKKRSVLDGPIMGKDRDKVQWDDSCETEKSKNSEPYYTDIENLPIVSVKPIKKRISPRANKAESNIKTIPKKRKRIPWNSSVREKSRDLVRRHCHESTSFVRITTQTYQGQEPGSNFRIVADHCYFFQWFLYCSLLIEVRLEKREKIAACSLRRERLSGSCRCKNDNDWSLYRDITFARSRQAIVSQIVIVVRRRQLLRSFVRRLGHSSLIQYLFAPYQTKLLNKRN